MGRIKSNPKYNVLSLRVDGNLVARIREAARRCESVSDFLELAAREKIAADENRQYREQVDSALGC